LCVIGYAERGSVGKTLFAESFKKKDGYLRSINLSKELGLYRQNYCGCIYSKRVSENG
ncbi:MAG: epoxyqueuosine reductase QueH, partial [Ruminococcus sp.]|nr:epoxyqueuosine reductase QueH [Ruminococcus sp.]